jgi:hypothetical protein
MISRIILICLTAFSFACDRLGEEGSEQRKQAKLQQEIARQEQEEQEKRLKAQAAEQEERDKRRKAEAFEQEERGKKKAEAEQKERGKIEETEARKEEKGKPQTGGGKTEKAEPKIEEIPQGLQPIFNDPELKLLSKNKKELEDAAKPYLSAIEKANLMKDQIERRKEFAQIFLPLLQIRLLQDDDAKAVNIVIKIFEHADLNAVEEAVKKMDAKRKMLLGSLSAAEDVITPRTKGAIAESTSALLEYSSLIGKIKGNFMAVAPLKGITLPSGLTD